MPQLVDKQTGQLVDADPAEAPALLASGAVGVRADRPVDLVAPDGSLVNADAQHVDQLLQGGYRLASDQESQEAADAAEYGDTGSQVAAGLEGAARGLTFGLSDMALAGAGVTSREDIAKRQQYNPITSGVGEAAGAIGGALLTGGSGALAKGAGLLAPAALATRAGQAAEGLVAGTRAVKALEAGGALGRAAATGVRLGAQGALEGALYGAAKAVDEDYLRDHEITAERIAVGMGLGALTGGAFGGGAGVLASLSKSAVTTTREAIGGLLGRGERQAAQEAVESTLRQETAEASRLTGSTAGDASAVFDLSLEPVYAQRGPLVASQLDDAQRSSVAKLFESARAAQGGFESAQQNAVRSISSELDQLLKTADEADTLAAIAAKRRASESFNGLVHSGASPETNAVFSSLRSKLDDIQSTYGDTALADGGGAALVKRLRQRVDAHERKFTEALKRGDVGDAYMEVDDLKRALGNARRTQNALAREYIEGPTGVEGLYGEVQRHLEDPELWGELAETQRLVNGTWAERIRRSKDAQVRRFFLEGGDVATNRFESQAATNREALGGFLNQLGNAESEGVEAAFRRYVRSIEMDVKNRASVWGSPELQSKSSDLSGLVDRIEGAMNAVALSRRDAQRWQQLTHGLSDTPGPVGWLLKGGATLTQKVAGFAEAASQRSTKTVSRTWFRRATEGEQSVERAADGLIKQVRTGRSRAGKAADASIPVLGTQLVLSDPETYERVIQHVARLRDPESPTRQAMRANLAPVALEAPEMAAAIDAHVQRTADFLAAQAGPTSQRLGVDVFSRFDRPRHDAGKAARLARYARAAEDPRGALERIASGEVLREDVETLRALYPRLYARFAQRALRQVAELDEKPSYEARRALGRALGVPVDRAGRPEYTAWLQSIIGASNAATQAYRQGPAPTRAPEIDEAYASRTDQLIGRR